MRYPELPKVTKEHHPNHPNLIRSVELRKLKDKKDRTFHPSTVEIEFSTYIYILFRLFWHFSCILFPQSK